MRFLILTGKSGILTGKPGFLQGNRDSYREIRYPDRKPAILTGKPGILIFGELIRLN